MAVVVSAVAFRDGGMCLVALWTECLHQHARALEDTSQLLLPSLSMAEQDFDTAAEWLGALVTAP